MEAGAPGESGAAFSHATCAWRSERGRFAESTRARSRAGGGNAKLRSRTRTNEQPERRTETRARTERSREIKSCRTGPIAAAINNHPHLGHRCFARLSVRFD